MKKIITISGNCGSGKSTVSKLLAEKLNYKCYVMGDVMRKLAEENNMDIVTFQEAIKNTSEFDHKVDNMIIELGKNNENIILVSRTAWHFIPDSFKVYLYVNEDYAAQRIYNDGDRINEKKYDTIEQAKEFTIRRNKLEYERYNKVYGIDVTNLENYDLVIDTSEMKVDEVLEKIIQVYNEKVK